MKQVIHRRNVGIWKCMNIKCKQRISRLHGSKVIVIKYCLNDLRGGLKCILEK